MTHTTLSYVKSLPVRDCNHNVLHFHGTNQAYNQCKCRCSQCKEVANAHRRQLSYATGKVQPRMAITKARNHLNTLVEKGMPWWRLEEQTGVPHSTLRAVASGRHQEIFEGTRTAILTARYEPTVVRQQHRIHAIGAQRRLRHLALLGWSPAAIARHTGIPEYGIQVIRSGARKSITKERHEKIRAASRQLQHMKPPADTYMRRAGVATTIAYARSQGWVTIYAWEDPDDVASTCESAHVG